MAFTHFPFLQTAVFRLGVLLHLSYDAGMAWSRKFLEAAIGNPFAIHAALATPDREMTKFNVPATLKKLLVGPARDLDQAKLLVLAIGHRDACQYPTQPDKVLTSKDIPAKLAKHLPRPLASYRRIAMAAGRCYHRLMQIRGTSSAMNNARRDTWAACFGDSLRHTLDLEQVIRDHDVLVLGETGTGKESFAEAIQLATPGDESGAAAPSSAINAAAIPDTLVESELFGHVKGAFTGALDTRVGRLRSASGGCFFLDEVGDLPFTTQVKLLRVIETNEVFPLGADRSHTVDLRYVAATHKNLDKMVCKDQFRRDLYQRLAGNVISIPALRQRPEDIVEIGMAFVHNYLGSPNHPQLAHIDTWLRSKEACSYGWPGNVRELQNVLRDLMLGLPPRLSGRSASPIQTASVPEHIAGSQSTLQEVSDWYLTKVLQDNQYNYTKAATILGLDRSTVRRRARQLAPSKQK